MILLAAFDLLLERLTGQEDLVVGAAIANRERVEIEGLIGCFVNTLALRADLSARPSLGGLLRQVRETSLAAYAHQDLPFEKLVEALAAERDPGTTPLFQVLMVLQNAWSAGGALDRTAGGAPDRTAGSALDRTAGGARIVSRAAFRRAGQPPPARRRWPCGPASSRSARPSST